MEVSDDEFLGNVSPMETTFMEGKFPSDTGVFSEADDDTLLDYNDDVQEDSSVQILTEGARSGDSDCEQDIASDEVWV